MTTLNVYFAQVFIDPFGECFLLNFVALILK